MGSSGPGNFSDYSNYPRAIKGVTGAVDSEDKCALAFSTLIEDVDTCEYYSKKGMLPAVDTEVSVEFKVRLVVKSNDGLIIGYLPTKYNYLRNCIVKGFTYTGVVSNVSSTPINTVIVDITPSTV